MVVHLILVNLFVLLCACPAIGLAGMWASLMDVALQKVWFPSAPTSKFYRSACGWFLLLIASSNLIWYIVTQTGFFG